ncbi:MAG TPA: Gfo/Idh/MocA family oxidoreductase [Polyangiaceae bacterium]|nr:Gfo/Idh/MocA family oxidoreductase [Polyangiaceae bacterium]
MNRSPLLEKAMSISHTRKVRYAVMGLGNIAQVAVLPAFANARENSELVALVSSDQHKLQSLAERYDVKITGSYDDLDRILASGAIDALYVATPNTEHRRAVERAARAHVHVLCEKPLAATVADCRSMLRTASEAKIKLMTAYRLHFEQANLRAVERLRRGEIGEPRIFSSVFSQQVREGDIRTRADLGGGALFDMGIYCVNAARYLFQDEPVEAMAFRIQGESPRFDGTDETTSVILRFPENRIAQFTASQGAARVSEFRVVGTLGDLQLEAAYGYHEKSEEQLTIDGKTKTTTTPQHDQFAPELLHFSKCILEDREPEPSGEEGLADVQILESIVQAAALGRKVTLTPILRDQRPNGQLEMRKPPIHKVETVNAPAPSK